MILSFSHFHPLKGLPPETEHFLGADIVLRARAILAGWKTSEIRKALTIINWLIEQSPANKLALKQLRKEAAAVSGKRRRKNSAAPLFRDFGTDIHALKLCMGEFDIEGCDGLPHATWPELFAVLALALVNEAAECEFHHSKPSTRKTSSYLQAYLRFSHVSPWLAYAASAAAMAEGLALGENATKGKKKKLSLRKQAASIEQHEKTMQAVKALDNYYCSGGFKSLRDATMMFIEAHPKKVAHLALEGRFKTLSEGLSLQLDKRHPRN